MTNTEQFAALYGPPAQHSDYTIGERVVYLDGQSEGHGSILYIAAPAGEPQRLIIEPEVGLFPVEISIAEVIERA